VAALHRVQVAVPVAAADRQAGDEVVQDEVVQDDDARLLAERVHDPAVRVRVVADVVEADVDVARPKATAPADRDDIDAWIDRTQQDLAAGKKANPEPNAQRAIAAACHKAIASVTAATERCQAGPRPID